MVGFIVHLYIGNISTRNMFVIGTYCSVSKILYICRESRVHKLFWNEENLCKEKGGVRLEPILEDGFALGTFLLTLKLESKSEISW